MSMSQRSIAAYTTRRPYDSTPFRSHARSTTETDIEHIVATSEAPDSGLCAVDRPSRTRFAQDLRDLTLASPQVNRFQKSGKDAGERLPDQNRCWFAGRVVKVKRAYGLTVDRREAAALYRIFRDCASTSMEPMGVPDSTSVSRSDRTGRGRQGRRAPPVRRQPQWQDHVQGGAAARHRARPPVASRVPVHAGQRRGWRRLRVKG